jgi:hypothetical protein
MAGSPGQQAGPTGGAVCDRLCHAADTTRGTSIGSVISKQINATMLHLSGRVRGARPEYDWIGTPVSH